MVQPKRLRATLVAAALVFALVAPNWHSSLDSLLPRVFVPALAAWLAFSLRERWPRRLPRPLARWALQVVAATLAVPLVELVFYFATVTDGQTSFWDVPDRINGFLVLCSLGMLVSSWVAMTGLLRQRDALLQAQVEPHFLFNTLANVRRSARPCG